MTKSNLEKIDETVFAFDAARIDAAIADDAKSRGDALARSHRAVTKLAELARRAERGRLAALEGKRRPGGAR